MCPAGGFDRTFLTACGNQLVDIDGSLLKHTVSYKRREECNIALPSEKLKNRIGSLKAGIPKGHQ